MGDHRPKSLQLSELKTQQAAEHSNTAHTALFSEGVVSLGKVIGYPAGSIRAAFEIQKKDLKEGYQSSREAGNSVPVAAAHGVLEFLTNETRRWRTSFRELKDMSKLGHNLSNLGADAAAGLNEGFEAGLKETNQTYAKTTSPTPDM